MVNWDNIKSIEFEDIKNEEKNYLVKFQSELKNDSENINIFFDLFKNFNKHNFIEKIPNNLLYSFTEELNSFIIKKDSEEWKLNKIKIFLTILSNKKNKYKITEETLFNIYFLLIKNKSKKFAFYYIKYIFFFHYPNEEDFEKINKVILMGNPILQRKFGYSLINTLLTSEKNFKLEKKILEFLLNFFQYYNHHIFYLNDFLILLEFSYTKAILFTKKFLSHLYLDLMIEILTMGIIPENHHVVIHIRTFCNAIFNDDNILDKIGEEYYDKIENVFSNI